MHEIKWKIGTLKADSAAQIVMGRPVKSYLDGLKSASSTGMKDSDGDTVYLFDDLAGDVNAGYADEQDAACINTVLTAIGYFNPGRFDELIDAAAAAGGIWSKACAAYDAAAKAADSAESIAASTDTAAKEAADKVKAGTGTKTAADAAAKAADSAESIAASTDTVAKEAADKVKAGTGTKTAADAAAKDAKEAARAAADAAKAAEKADADKAAALPAKQAADKALADYLADVPEYINFDPFTKDHKRDIAKFIYDRDKAGKLDKPAAMRVAHDFVVAHYREWIEHFAYYINEIPAEGQLPRDSDGELIHSRKDWRDRIHKALTTRSFKAGIGYKVDLRDGLKIKGTDEKVEPIRI